MMPTALKNSVQTIKSVITGMGITMRHLFSPSVTIEYPEERDVLSPGVRSKLYVNIDDCIGCNLCARACPVNCIDIETVKATDDVDLGKTSTGNPKRFWLTRFDIDMSKCMYCDLCVYPCPTNCIYMVPEYEYSEYDRSNLVFHFSNLTPDRVTEVTMKAEKEKEEVQRKKEEEMRKKKEEADRAVRAKEEAASAAQEETDEAMNSSNDTKSPSNTEG